MKSGQVLSWLVALMLVSSFAMADYAPQEMSFSGQIFSSGCGYSAAPQNATFTLWTAASGGSQVGNPLTLSNVGVYDGVINVILTNPIVASILSWNTSSGALYLQMQLANGWTSERKKLTSTPYALTCTEADSIGGLTLTDLDSRYVLSAGGNFDTRYIRNQYDGAQSANHWISGYSRADTAMYTPALYDTNNTGYYLDPNGTNRLNYGVFDNLHAYGNIHVQNRAHVGGDGTNHPAGAGLYVGGIAYQAFGANATIYANWDNHYGGGVMISDDGGFFDYNDGWIQFRGSLGLLFPDGNHRIQAPIMYDANNSGYYVDPNSVSRMNDIRPDIIYDPNNTGYYIDINGVSRFEDIRPSIVYDGNDTGYYLDLNSVSNAYNIYAYYLRVRNEMHIPFIYDWDNTGYYLNPNGDSRMWNAYYDYLRVYNEMHIPLIYDWNNTGYYMDPNNVSVFNDIRTIIMYDHNTAYRFDGDGTSQMNHAWTRYQYDYDNTGYYFDINGWSQIVATYVIDLRPQYGYDWNNTGYYFDFNSTTFGYRFVMYYFYYYYWGRKSGDSAPEKLTDKDLFAKLNVIRNIQIGEASITEYATAPGSNPDPFVKPPKHDDPALDQAEIDANNYGSQAGMLQSPAEKYGIKDRVRNQLILYPSSLPKDMVDPQPGPDGGEGVSMPDLTALSIAGVKAVDLRVDQLQKENDRLLSLVKDLTARLEKLEGKSPAKP
ncbi:MAG: hypothetical protein C4523_10085 [Myxococcales bacterium]|nr:MAG: hypothetical protein C4523_10085 [Myxococcales bacterium]